MSKDYWKDIGKRIGDFVKSGRILVHQHEVRADNKETLLGTAPVYHASEGDLEALSLIHDKVGGSKYITATVNTSYQGAVGTSIRNLVRPTNKKKDAITFDEALVNIGLVKPALYTNHKYGSTQETDAILRDCNKRIREIDSELAEAKQAKDRDRIKDLFKEEEEVRRTKRDREMEIEFGLMD